MATEKERGRLGDILMREFAEYAAQLTAEGYDWAAVWATGAWPAESRLRWLHGRFLLAQECAAMIGHRFSDDEITQFHREHLAHGALFPDGPPSMGSP
ncbi:hypothetical protein ACFUJY_29750 [Streptomyces sp. NPDC057249]|uniref:hypothetical protein n=1 Tax=Streptomyces sp. NPDC057249 TaxID=3346067 RepID=UPI00362C7BBD